ncbi:MAG: diaminopimelate epimerase [Chlorobi bacterium]|nr:diaminopimelate epimerase [Chlorobiota bacterium]
MKTIFYKYHGTGNDFIIIDNRKGHFDSKNKETIRFLCDRHFGIGADGLMLLEDNDQYEFTMRYFNSDGNEATMCGNGGRCISAFAVHQGIVNSPEHFSFMAVDGLHEASYSDGIVSLKMSDVNDISANEEHFFLNTGSPHHVEFVNNINETDVYGNGKKIRYSDKYKSAGGTNVNFVEQTDESHIKVRTYERGVENETLSCGTGVVASAISTAIRQGHGNNFTIEVPGGILKVNFETQNNNPVNIWLTGPATFVFKGEIEIRQQSETRVF